MGLVKKGNYKLLTQISTLNVSHSKNAKKEIAHLENVCHMNDLVRYHTLQSCHSLLFAVMREYH